MKKRQINRVIDGKKKCADCFKVLPIKNFIKRKIGQPGYISYCRACSAIRTTAYNQKNRKWYNNYQKAYQAKYRKNDKTKQK